MEHVEHFLKSLGLGQYVPAFENNGYDNLGIILTHDDDDFQRLGPFLGMLPGHLYLLQKAVGELKNPRCVSTINRVPIIQLDGNTTTTDGLAEPAAATADVAAVAAAATILATSVPKSSTPDHDVPSTYFSHHLSTHIHSHLE